jgi:hypothetical protein
MPLNPQVTLHAFEKWAVDFFGPINPLARRIGARYIITTTNYLRIWAEEEQNRYCNAKTTAWFLFENIVTRFGCHKILMSDQGTHFLTRQLQ